MSEAENGPSVVESAPVVVESAPTVVESAPITEVAMNVGVTPDDVVPAYVVDDEPKEEVEKIHSFAGEPYAPADVPFGCSYAEAMIKDAISSATEYYFLDEDNTIKNLWCRTSAPGGKDARRWGLWLRNPTTSWFLSTLATVDLVLACLTVPGFDGSIGVNLQGSIPNIALALSGIIWLIFCFVHYIKTYYMLQMKEYWFVSGQAAYWLIVQSLVLYVVTPAAIAVHFAVDDHKILQHANSLGPSELICPVAFKSIALGLCRAYVFIYYNQQVRDALVVLYRVITRLGPFFSLTFSCLVAHFFVFQGLAYDVTPSDGSGQAGKNGFGYGGNTADAIYNIFGLMTTVNHPDVMMWLVDAKWITMVVIISFMFFTMILAQNLLLGYVYGEYCEALDEKKQYDAKLRSALLDAAFDVIIAVRIREGGSKDPWITNQELLYILRTAESASGGDPKCLDNPDHDKMEMVVRLIDNNNLSRNGEGQQDGIIERESMHELQVFYNCGYEQLSLNQLNYRQRLSNALLEKQLTEAPHHRAKAEYLNTMEHNAHTTKEEWAAQFPRLYHLAFEWGANVEWCFMNPWGGRAIPSQIHVVWFLFYLIYNIFDSGNSVITTALATLQTMSCIIQTLFVAFTFCADMRIWQPFRFFNPNQRRAFENFTSVCLFLTLWLSFFCRCGSGGCITEVARVDMTKTAVGVDTLSKVFQVMSFAVMTPSVKQLLGVIYNTFHNIGPHLGLFAAAYFAFAGMGIGLFCGLCTENTSNGGPGDWTSTTLLSKATNTAWASTAYGGSSYYINNLNFNGFMHSFYALYVIMIQNNWTTVVNGPVEVTDKHSRWFFIAFNLVISFVMMNVLVGAIVDSLTLLREQAAATEDPNIPGSSVKVICNARLACTVAPSGRYYGESWQVSRISIYSGIHLDAENLPLFKKTESQLLGLERLVVEEQEIQDLREQIKFYEEAQES